MFRCKCCDYSPELPSIYHEGSHSGPATKRRMYYDDQSEDFYCEECRNAINATVVADSLADPSSQDKFFRESYKSMPGFRPSSVSETPIVDSDFDNDNNNFSLEVDKDDEDDD